MRLSINVPNQTPIAVIEAALAQFGVSIVQPKRREKIEQDFRPLIYRKVCRNSGEYLREGFRKENPNFQTDETGDLYVEIEMDGVSVLKAIRKMESNRRAQLNRDTRKAEHFPPNGASMTTSEYVALMDSKWGLKRAQYA